jgi:cell cycle arrest protein BUB3
VSIHASILLLSQASHLLSTDALISASWDRTLRFWDSRSPTPQQSSHDTPERVYQIDLVNNTLVVAMASRLFHIYDIRKMDSPAQQRESSLKLMTRSLACMADGQGERVFFFCYLGQGSWKQTTQAQVMRQPRWKGE